jgi:hypothetical protein
MWQNASPEERASIVKLAAAHQLAKSTLQTDGEKQAYDAGAAAGADMVDSGALGGAPGGAAGAPAPDAAGADPSADPAGADNITDDDIIAVLSELVQSGKIKPEEAEAILQALQSGGAEANPTAPAGADAAAPTSAMPDAPPDSAPPEQKEAFSIVKSASVATDLIMTELTKAAAATPVVATK